MKRGQRELPGVRSAYLERLAKSCRRCDVCVGLEHHWIDNSECGGEDDPDAELPWSVCKHCDATADECPDCDDGGIWESNDRGITWDKSVEKVCPRCKGVGRIQRLTQTRQAGIQPGPKGDENPPQESARLEPVPLPAAAPGDDDEAGIACHGARGGDGW